MAPRALTILAIDDRPDNLTTLKAVLSDPFPAARVLTAQGGLEGLALAAEADPDVILLDLIMPGMDGFEVCRQLKANSELRDVPIVILTALRTDQAARVKALEFGAEAFLTKPVDEVELTAQVRAMAKIKEANTRHRQEAEHLTELVVQRTAELETELAERRKAEREVRQANDGLVRSRTAMLNVLYDLRKEVSVRAAAENGLRQSEARFRTLIEQAGDGFELLDAQGRLLDVNGAFLKLTGYTKPEALALDIHAIAPQITPDEFQTRFLSAAGLAPATFETVHRRRDGTFFPVEVTVSRIELGGAPQCMATVRDITTRSRVQRRLTELNECLLSLGADATANIQRLTALCGEHLGAASALYNRLENGRLNPVGRWQLPPDFAPDDETDGHLCHEVIRGNADQAVVLRNLQETPYARTDPGVRCHGLQTYIGHAVRSSGVAVGAVCAVFLNDAAPGEIDRRFLGIVAAAIGREEERLQAGESLRHERDRAQNYLNTVEAIIVAMDGEGHVTLINGKGCRLLGWHETEVLGRPWFSLYVPQPDGLERLYPLFQKYVAGEAGGLEYQEAAIVTRTGEIRQIAWHHALLRDDLDRVTGTLSAGLDITASKQAEAQIAAHLAELRRWHELTLGRETRILELKREVNDALARANQPPRYTTTAGESA